MIDYTFTVIESTHQALQDQRVTPQEIDYYAGIMTVALLTMVFNIMIWRAILKIYQDAVKWTLEDK